MNNPSRPADPAEVRDNPAAGRYEIDVGGQIAELRYERRPGAIALLHTEVPESLRGRGLAQALARHGLDEARAAGVRVIAICPFVRAYLKKHPEYQDLVTGQSS